MSSRLKVIPATEARNVQEIIVRVVHNIDHSVEAVMTYAEADADGVLTEIPNSIHTATFSGDIYTELMSEYPEWSSKKPAGVFRDSDIFALIDSCHARPAVDTAPTSSATAIRNLLNV